MELLWCWGSEQRQAIHQPKSGCRVMAQGQGSRPGDGDSRSQVGAEVLSTLSRQSGGGVRHKPCTKSSGPSSDLILNVNCMSPKKFPLPCPLFLLFASISSLTYCIIYFITLSLRKPGLNERQQSLSVFLASELKAVPGL